MKFKLMLFLCFYCVVASAQNAQNLMGSWIAKKVTYGNGAELPDENIQKYTFAKYTFSPPNKISMSEVYYKTGAPMVFEIGQDMLLIKLVEGGSIINRFRIEKSGRDSLILLSPGPAGMDDPASLRYTFIPESVSQGLLTLTGNDVYSVSGRDTIYNGGRKIYATYNGDDFRDYLRSNIGHGDYMSKKSGHIVATFIVNKSGVADSLKIVHGIDANYDKYFTKVFYSAKKDWKPATLNGKNVSVKMEQEITYYGANVNDMVLAFQMTGDADRAYKEGEYETALHYYNDALNYQPTNTTNLYQRAICKLKLGDTPGACADWQKIKSLGNSVADIMSAKYCK